MGTRTDSSCAPAGPPLSGDWVPGYFADHLGSRMHRPLLPGLKSLSTAFSIQIDGCGTYAVEIAAGQIQRSEPCDGDCVEQGDCHVRMDAEAFARIVSGKATPQSLFVRRRLRISGNILRALSAACAMEEFFRGFPFHPPEKNDT